MKPRDRTNGSGASTITALRSARALGDSAVGVDALRSFASDVVVRLSAAGALPERKTPPSDMIERFCDALIADDADVSRTMVRALQDAGMSPDTLCLDVLAPAARRLGERWVEDTATFFDVTLGSGRLHAALRIVQRDFGEGVLPDPELTALFCPLPGDSHVLGVTMAAGFFRRAGWSVDLLNNPDLDELLVICARQNHRLIGLTCGCHTMIGALSETVQRLREVAPEALIAIGGAITAAEPDCCRISGADVICADVAQDAVRLQTAVRRRHAKHSDYV